MRNLLGAIALVVALLGPASAQTSPEAGLTITVQDLSAKDGVLPSFAVSAESSGPILASYLVPELDARDPRNEGAVWHFGPAFTVSPKTKLVVAFNLPAYKMAVAYGTILIGRNGGNYDDYTRVVDASTGRITLVLINPRDTPALAEYHWKYVERALVAP